MSFVVMHEVAKDLRWVVGGLKAARRKLFASFVIDMAIGGNRNQGWSDVVV